MGTSLMPTVPFTPRAPAAPKIDETFAAMAAADLHGAGMLFDRTMEEREAFDADRLNMITSDDAAKEAFVKKHGVETAIDELDRELEQHEGAHTPGTGGYEAMKEIRTWRGRLQDRLTKPEDVGS